MQVFSRGHLVQDGIIITIWLDRTKGALYWRLHLLNDLLAIAKGIKRRIGHQLMSNGVWLVKTSVIFFIRIDLSNISVCQTFLI